MRFNFAMASFILFSAALAFGGESHSTIKEALAGIQSTDSAIVQRSIDDLRNAGPDGLEALLHEYDHLPDPTLIPAVDAVAGQRGAIWSRLYWYTDLARAQAAAREQVKPILYLRLMGKLTDEYSCANSRFFRTVLYSNVGVSAMLRERFVLVWTSERPVPIVTIDYGDGRTLKRTLTGNSIHYVLDSHGQVFDALPGLFDPVTFARVVSDAGAMAREGDSTRGKYLQRADDAILRQWKQDVFTVDPQLLAANAQIRQIAEKADAAMAMRRAVSKTAIELPLLRAISPQFAAALDQSIDALDASAWRQIAELHAADAAIDEQSIAVIRAQNPTVYSDPAALDRTVQQFQQTIAEDSVRDNYQMRRQVLAWLRQSVTPVTLEGLNRRIYSDLFLTPRSDPWLGLMPQGMYTALTDDGCCSAAPQ
jgi:hypothetical protein